MADPRAPVDIASFPSELEASAFVGLLREEGIQAAVFGRGASLTGLVQDCVDWRLMVPAEDAERARQAIISAREEHDAAPPLAKCPGCEYSLAGLQDADRCPECGLVLEGAREAAKSKGLIIHEATVISAPVALAPLWIVLASAVAIGIVALILEIGLELPLWVSEAWWTPVAPVGAMVLVIGVALLVRRRLRRARLRANDSAT